jgi:hypothetical protein
MTDAARDFPAGSIRRAVARLGDVWWLAFEDPKGVARNEHFTAELRDSAIMRARSFARQCGDLDPPSMASGLTDAEIEYHATLKQFSASLAEAIELSSDLHDDHGSDVAAPLAHASEMLARATRAAEVTVRALTQQGRLELAFMYAVKMQPLYRNRTKLLLLEATLSAGGRDLGKGHQ